MPKVKSRKVLKTFANADFGLSTLDFMTFFLKF